VSPKSVGSPQWAVGRGGCEKPVGFSFKKISANPLIREHPCPQNQLAVYSGQLAGCVAKSLLVFLSKKSAPIRSSVNIRVPKNPHPKKSLPFLLFPKLVKGFGRKIEIGVLLFPGGKQAVDHAVFKAAIAQVHHGTAEASGFPGFPGQAFGQVAFALAYGLVPVVQQ
jgi:hypothetical protein